MPVRMWKHRLMMTVCTIQNQCGILEGVILHIMPSQLEVKGVRERVMSRHVPRENTTSRTVTVMQ